MSFAMPATSHNDTCPKCNGTGVFKWQTVRNNRPIVKEGECFSCRGAGVQSHSQIARNNSYNRFKLSEIAA